MFGYRARGLWGGVTCLRHRVLGSRLSGLRLGLGKVSASRLGAHV